MSLFRDESVVQANIGDIGIKEGKLIMVEPRMKGFNSENRPYDLDARQAVQDLKKPGIIDLKDIIAKLPTNSGGFVDIVAKTGNYNTSKDMLKLNKDIVLTRPSGMKIMLDTAVINLKNGRLVSNKPVKVTTSTANIRADGVEVIDNGAVIVFKKRVRMTIQPATDSK
jgi:lipopolysaccharide export system protein LptC